MASCLASGLDALKPCPKCPKCRRTFKRRAGRSKHMNKQHPHPDATCPVCSKTFYEPKRRDHHARDTNHNAIPARRPNINISTSTALARQFHDHYARQPRKDNSFKAYTDVTDLIFHEMKEAGLVNRREYVGSTYEGTNVKESSDFDVLFVKREGNINASTTNAPPGYAILHYEEGSARNELTAQKERNTFEGVLQRLLDSPAFLAKWRQLRYRDTQLVLRRHGPAVQLDVLQMASEDILTSVDIVPAKELPDGTMYVAKAPKSSGLTAKQKETFWHKSSSLRAKELLMTADEGAGCRKEAYRSCKVIRDREQNLHHITSFQLKSPLLKLMAEKPASAWTRDQLGDRIIDILQRVANAYVKGELPNYFEPGINLLAGVDVETRPNTAIRLNKLINNPEQLFADP